MASKQPDQKPSNPEQEFIGVPGRTRMGPLQVVHIKAIPSPPGTKVPRQTPAWLEELPSPWPGRLIAAGSAAAAALVVGILIGRFLLP